MATLAILDLGTNTFHLLIAEIIDGNPKILFQETLAVKLGEGGINNGHISQAALNRGLTALKSFKKTIEIHKAQVIRAVATSALRTASNGIVFLDSIKKETDIRPDIITGEREAELIYYGVKAAIDMGEECCLIMDIGGGSVEFIICNSKQVFWKKSFDIGAARLMEQFHHSDPINEPDIQSLFSYLDSTLHELHQELGDQKPNILIGSAGVFETYAQLINPYFKVEFERPEVNIKLADFKRIAKLVLESTHEQRAEIPSIIPIRVDMIVTATLLTEYILKHHPFQQMKVSTHSLKEGLLFEWIASQK